MHLHGLLIGHQRRHEPAVGRRSRIGVDDGEEIVALLGTIADPHDEIVARGGGWLRLRQRRRRSGRAAQSEHERRNEVECL